jgi:hypothetical protein
MALFISLQHLENFQRKFAIGRVFIFWKVAVAETEY